MDREAWHAAGHGVAKSQTPSRARASSCQAVGTTWFFSSCADLCETHCLDQVLQDLKLTPVLGLLKHCAHPSSGGGVRIREPLICVKPS